jgi:hypothetical protein
MLLTKDLERRTQGSSKSKGLRASPPGGLGSVAGKGLTGGRFWICGNDWTYMRILGSVAGKGLRE